MPAATVYLVQSVSGDHGEPVGSISVKADGTTFAEARVMLGQTGQFDFEYNFLDVNLTRRMGEKWEAINTIQDFGGKIIVIPKFIVGDVMDPTVLGSRNPSDGQTILGSSNAFNKPSLIEDHEEEQVLSPQRDEVRMSIPSVTENLSTESIDPHVKFESTYMSSDFQKIWVAQVEKLKEHLKWVGCTDHNWKVTTWDKDLVPCGKLSCCECDTHMDGASKGVMDRLSITNAFTNFKSKRLLTPKHNTNYARNRKLAIDAKEIARKAACNALSNRAILEVHVKIMEKINNLQNHSEGTFQIIGDVTKEPVELHKFKILCTFCHDHLILVPKQRNLESNLEAHCGSLSHMNAVQRSLAPRNGVPISTGKVGRPRHEDKRDLRQRTIAGFFIPQLNERASSSGSQVSDMDKGKGTIDHFSLLCWGLWRESVRYGDENRLVKKILLDPLKEDGEWYAEPLASASVLCLSSKELCVIEGLFRHVNCNRVSLNGGGFMDLTCQNCYNIKFLTDFRLRVARENTALEKRGLRSTGKGRRLDYLTIPKVQNQAGFYRIGQLRERKIQRRLYHRLLMLQARVPKIGAICSESANRKDIMKFCTSIILAHNRGAFGGRGALWDMLMDIASNLNKKKQGQRYRKGTKLLMQMLFLHGGRRVVDCLASNGIGPTVVTLQRNRTSMAVFRAGLHKEQFEFIAKLYSTFKRRLGICGPIPVFLAEDETCVKKTVRWSPKHDTLIGFCGPKADHKCITGLEIVVGEGETGFDNIKSAFENNVVGHQARCIIVNPLVAGLPRLCLLATGTCNKFDATWIRKQWDDMQCEWTSICAKDVGPILGHSSDGDSRRRKLMLEDYSGRGTQGHRKASCGKDGN